MHIDGSATRVPQGAVRVTTDRPRPSVVACRVAGEVDLLTAPELFERLMDAGAEEGCCLVVDLTAVRFFAAAGVRVLDCVERSRGGERGLALVGANALVRKVLDLCQARHRQCATLEEAIVHHCPAAGAAAGVDRQR